MAEHRIACPTCKRETVYAPSNAWRPFCSERCRQIDLGAWATEQFRVAAEPVEDDGDAPVVGAPGSEPPDGASGGGGGRGGVRGRDPSEPH